MSLKTYDRVWNDAQGGGKAAPWPFKHLYVEDNDKDVLEPGDWVFHETYQGVGMVIAIDDDQICILWSEEPRSPGFGNIAFPIVRRVFNPLIASQLVSVQPMTAPVGAIFYLDYVYGEDAKCTEGPLWSRLYWRARRAIRKSWVFVKNKYYDVLNEVKRINAPPPPPQLTQGQLIQNIIEEMQKGNRLGHPRR